ncbi:RNA-dependent RNA polymerase, partial [Toyo virus]
EKGSSIKQTHRVRFDDAGTLIHDFTFAHWSETTDELLQDHFPTIRDDYNRWTPDFIGTRLDGVKDVVEFTTFRSVDERAARRRFLEKVGKYQMPLEIRSHSVPGILLFAVCVFEGGVVSNLDLTDLEVDELCFRFSVVKSVFGTLREQMLVQDYSDPEESKLERAAQQTFLRIQHRFDVTEANFHPFSREMFKNFREGDADEEYASRAIGAAFEEAKQTVLERNFFSFDLPADLRLEANSTEAEIAVATFIKEVDSKAERPDHAHKSTIPFPGIIPKVTGDTLSLMGLTELPAICILKDATGMAWEETISKVRCGEVERLEENADLEREIALTGEDLDHTEDFKQSRQKYHRVDLSNLDMDVRLELAKQGVEAKEFRDNPVIKEKRSFSKKTFSLHADTEDINTFLQEEGHLFDQEFEQDVPDSFEKCVQSAAHFQELHGLKSSNNPWYSSILTFLRLPIGVWLFFVTCVGVELSISLKQHCGRRKFIIKKLRFFDVYLLIKPTNSGSHIFYSIGFHKSAIMGLLHTSSVFKALHEEDGWCWTEFHSFKMSKLTNPVKCLSSMHSLYWYWREFYEIPFWTGSASDYQTCQTRANFMFKLTLLILLEDKAKSEEIITLSRYVMMEGFKAEPELPKPHKMIEKLPTALRTKLQVWLTHKILDTMIRISRKPFSISLERGGLKWNGMFNPFIGETVISTQKLISLFYLGYLKNKEESPEQNASIKMYSKILEYELKHSKRYEYLGLLDPPPEDCRYHEYSPSLIKLLCKNGIHILRQKLGESWREIIHKEIIHEISKLDLERLATLKASSQFCEEWYTLQKDKTYHRCKVIERVSEYVTDQTSHVFQILEKCLEKIEDRGCMHICLFKKPQHGGLREIYVLGFEERVVQLVVETISRTICRHFPSETLTNPKSKLSIPELHGRYASKICGSRHQTIGTSDDARTWNQGHHVSKFPLMLIQFTKDELHPFLFRAGSLFMRKRIMLDQRLLSILELNSNLETNDPTLKLLHDVYHGNVAVDWMPKKGGYIQTETGMMQGILHYTSSLFHTILQVWMKKTMARAVRQVMGENTTRQVHVDVLQSSDDSGMLVSFPSDNVDITMRCRHRIAVMFEFKKILGKLIGIYSSVKSTSNTPFVLEFNSEFFFHTNHNRPVFRWIAAVDTISEQESLAARQEEMSNNLTSVLEGGGSFSLVTFCQYSQMFLHYVLLGLTVSPVFREFICIAREYMDPALGFFIMDPPFSPGLNGFKYNLWTACRKGSLGIKYKYFMTILESVTSPEEMKSSWKCLDTTTSGTFVQSVLIRWGDRKKWERLVDKIIGVEDWIEKIDDNPYILYRRPISGEEVRLKLAVKIHSPGVASSLSKGNAVVRIIASSVYILTRSVLSDNLMRLERGETAQKSSLLRRVLAFNGLLGSRSAHLSEDQMLLLFPHHQEYLSMTDKLSQLNCLSGKFTAKQSHITQTRIEVIEMERFMRVRAEDLVCDKWFGTNRARINPKQFDKEWDLLRTTIGWLRDTASETLALSPFNHHPPMQNFFSRLETKGRAVRITGSPIKQRSGVSNMLTAVRDNFFPGFQLTNIFDSAGMERSESASLIKHCAFLILAGPYTESRKKRMIEEVCTNLNQVPLRLNQYKSRLNSIGLIQWFLKSPEDPAIFEHICNTNSGVIGGFSKPQKSKAVGSGFVYYGSGTWRGIVYGLNIQIEVDSDKGSEFTFLSAVTIDSDSSREFLPMFLRTWCEEMNVSNKVTPRLSRSKKPIFFLYNFQMLSTISPAGCPIYCESSRAFVRMDLDINKLGLSIRGNTLNLRYYESVQEQARGYGRGMNMVSFTSRDSDAGQEEARALSRLLDQKKLGFASKEPSTSWMTMRALSSVSLDVLLKETSRTFLIAAGIDKDRLLKCIKEALISSLKRMGVFLSDLKEAVEKMATYALENAMEDCWNLCMEIDEIMKDDVFIPAEAEEAYEFNVAEFDIDVTDAGPFGLMSIEESTRARFYYHSIMEEVARKMISTLGHKGVRNLMVHKTYPKIHRDLVREWCKYLEMDFKDLEAIDDEGFGILLGPNIAESQIG